jgi:hypothetical protein
MAIHKVTIVADINIIVKIRLAPPVFAINNILDNVPKIRITVRISPVMIPVFMAFLITQYLSGGEIRIFLFKIGIF